MTVLEEARAVLATARENPQLALETARAILDRAEHDEERATAHFALGLAHRTLANGTASTEHLEEAAVLAGDSDELHGQILRSLAFNYAQTGDHAGATSTVVASIRLLTGQERELSRLQQAFMLLMRGEHRAALPVLTTAINGFTATGDDQYLSLTLYNRALVYMEFGEYDAATTDLERAYAISLRLENHVSAADAALHLSQVQGWRDDVPGAMRWHARSVEHRAAAGAANPVAETEHAFVLIQARLMREAEALLMSSIPRLEEAGDNEAIAIVARLHLAEVLTERGDYDGALTQVESAAASSPADGRWRFDIAAARHRIRAATGEANRRLLDSMLATAADMEANGERYSAAVERFRAVEIALEIGDLETAEALCHTARNITRTGPLWLQVQAWTALAQVRYARGNRHGAGSAARAGMKRLDEYRTGIGATDLRLHAAELGSKLAKMGVTLAVESKSPERIFAWSERLRSSMTALAAPDSGIEDALIELRRAAALARSAGPEESTRARRSLLDHERKVRDLSRQMGGTRTATPIAAIADVQDALGNRVLIEFVDVGTGLLALVVTATTARLVDVGPIAAVVELVDHLRFAAERIARPSTSTASRHAAIVSSQEIFASIEAALIAPLDLDADRILVIPTGPLHSVPMAMLFDVPVETAPSASAWLAAMRTLPQSGRPLVSPGPGLEHAAAEAAAIATIAGATTVATVADAVAALDGAALVHFACHARPRVDSPMFSSLVLNDGELTLYDIESLDSLPSTVILAACAGAASVQASGEEVLSLAGTFLAMGARTVVAPLFTVSDEITARVMRSFHQALAAGSHPAAALLAARSDDDPALALTAGSFACFGISEENMYQRARQ